ncbi:hypothetical protein [Nitriliruptor alkaliphilus]|uniref:hypothetical protein n=1 Tax=Nitriliruptor alkaliphilus TaxID=427918 RepID=UPI0006982DA6|nr:hypothetical protein [Nitriliruptor alkaliphilus]
MPKNAKPDARGALRSAALELFHRQGYPTTSVRVFYRERRFLSPETFEAIREKRDRFERLVTETIERGMSEGSLVAVESPRLIAFAIMGMCAWAHEWFNPHGDFTADAVASMYADLVLAGLRP